ncbi:hypothetical protein IAR50_000204 [Cryptococcus sp. DSM 104548]
MSVPSLASLKDTTSLASLLSLLFEPSPPLHALLVPAVHSQLAPSTRLESYNIIIDLCQATSSKWTWREKAEFLSGHPMIGEVKGLSKLSGKEQGGATPQEVLDRLAYLNQLYCKVYPGLRYITFVNGRSRAEIIPDFESVLGLSSTEQPPIDSEEVGQMVKAPESEEWKKECSRGLADVWLIGRARLSGMGLK